MNGKKRWSVEVRFPSRTGSGYFTIQFDGIQSTSERAARRQVRDKLKKKSVEYLEIIVSPIYTEKEAYEILLIETSQD